MTKEEAYRVEKTIDEYLKFVSLVRRMREAQEELDVFEYEHEFFEYEVIMKRKELTSKVIKLESDVDEYLKKMESIDQRKALEAENTEFDYGHNVKHYNED